MNIKKKILLAGLLTVAASSAAVAAFYPTHHYERAYYATADKTRVIGEATQYCSGKHVQTGKTSAHYRGISFPCSGGVGL
jgi:hypothetical protein